ncbi:MAG: FAD-dependent oxidoreductase, partial [Candidatus Gastranaerophilaceae bacterium]
MDNNNKKVVIIGGGLAGSEAALFLADRGIDVKLYEMRPVKPTPVHKTDNLAELVCSNSLGSFLLTNASGLLKEELRLLGSTLIPVADKFAVPAGNALAVDRDSFSACITEKIQAHPKIDLIHEHISSLTEFINDGSIILIATGPLTSDEFARSLAEILKESYLHF